MPSGDHVFKQGGQLYVEKFDHDGKTVEVKLGNAVSIKQILRIIDDSNNVEIVLRFKYLGQYEEIRIPRSELRRSKLLQYAEKGLDVNDFNAALYVRYLMEIEKKLTAVNVHRFIGFGSVADRIGQTVDIFRGVKCIGIQSSYIGKFNIKPKGGITGFREFVKTHVIGTPLTLALSLGLSAPLVGYIGKEILCQNLVSHLFGDSSSGKTTGAALAVSVGSCPVFGNNTLMRSYDSTENALLTFLVGNMGFPVALDEARKFPGKDFSRFMYRVESGIDKGRLTREGELKHLGEYRTSIVSTGEFSLSANSNESVGKEVRVQQYGSVAWTKNAKHAEAVSDYIRKNHGFQVYFLARYMLQLGREEVIRRYEENRNVFIQNSRVNDVFTSRVSIKYAVILTALQLSNECMGLNLPYDYVLEMLLDNEAESARNMDLSMKAYDYLLQQISINIKRFSQYHGHFDITDAYQDTWGICVPQKYNAKAEGKVCKQIIYIAAYKFKELLEKGGFEDLNVVIKKMKSDDLLDFEKGRDTRTRKISKDGSAVAVYGLKVYEDPEPLDSFKKPLRNSITTRSTYRTSEYVKTSSISDMLLDEDD
jgi:hypothetical protein